MDAIKLIKYLGRMFPKRLKESFDHVGKQVGCLPKEVNKIMICLDFDESILDRAIEFKPDLIITHHPFIFGTKAKVLKYDEQKRALVERLKNDLNNVPIYSYHTNFDTANNGMNDCLCQRLMLNDVYVPVDNPMMRIGYLNNPMEINDFCKYCLKKFDVSFGSLLNYGTKTISKVAIIGGGGSRDFITAKKEMADIYISGDCPHHVRRDIILNKYNYLDLPHEIEKIFIPSMTNYLKKIDNNLIILQVDHEKEGKVIIK